MRTSNATRPEPYATQSLPNQRMDPGNGLCASSAARFMCALSAACIVPCSFAARVVMSAYVRMLPSSKEYCYRHKNSPARLAMLIKGWDC